MGKRSAKLRQASQISLRKFAESVEMSPTYLSKVERGEFKPPSEEKIIAIARALGQDPDKLLALAGRVASELDDIIRRRPGVIPDLLRAAEGLSETDVRQLTGELTERKERSRQRS